MATDPRALMAAMMQGGGAGGQAPAQTAAQDPAAIIAQLAAMPPKQAMTLVQMNMARAQQQGNAPELQVWQQVQQMLNAAMQQQAQPQAMPGAPAGGNIVSQVLGGGGGM